MYQTKRNPKFDYFTNFTTTDNRYKKSTSTNIELKENIDLKNSKVLNKKCSEINLRSTITQNRERKFQMMIALSEIQTMIKTQSELVINNEELIKKIMLFFTDYYSDILGFKDIIEILIRNTFAEIEEIKFNPIQIKRSLLKNNIVLVKKVTQNVPTNLKISNLYVSEQPTQFSNSIKTHMKELQMINIRPIQSKRQDDDQAQVVPGKETESKKHNGVIIGSSFNLNDQKIEIKQKNPKKLDSIQQSYKKQESVKNIQIKTQIENKLTKINREKSPFGFNKTSKKESQSNGDFLSIFKLSLIKNDNIFCTYKELFSNLSECFCILQDKHGKTKTQILELRKRIFQLTLNQNNTRDKNKRLEEENQEMAKIIKRLIVEKFDVVKKALENHFEVLKLRKIEKEISLEQKNSLSNSEKILKNNNSLNVLIHEKTVQIEKIKNEKEILESKSNQINSVNSELENKLQICFDKIGSFLKEIKGVKNENLELAILKMAKESSKSLKSFDSENNIGYSNAETNRAETLKRNGKDQVKVNGETNKSINPRVTQSKKKQTPLSKIFDKKIEINLPKNDDGIHMSIVDNDFGENNKEKDSFTSSFAGNYERKGTRGIPGEMMRENLIGFLESLLREILI